MGFTSKRTRFTEHARVGFRAEAPGKIRAKQSEAAVAEAVVAEDVDDAAEPVSSAEVEVVSSVEALGGAVPPAAEQSPGAAIEVLSTGLSSWTNALGTAV